VKEIACTKIQEFLLSFNTYLLIMEIHKITDESNLLRGIWRNQETLFVLRWSTSYGSVFFLKIRKKYSFDQFIQFNYVPTGKTNLLLQNIKKWNFFIDNIDFLQIFSQYSKNLKSGRGAWFQIFFWAQNHVFVRLNLYFNNP